MKNLEKTLKSIVENPKYIFRLSVQGVMVGIFAGLMVCLYRFLLSESEHILRNYLTIIQTNVVYIVLFFVFLFNAFLNAASVLRSNAEKLSSNIYISGFFISARAIESLCFCPPETFVPP